MMEKQNKVKKAQLKAAGERKHERMVAKQRAHKEYTEYLKQIKKINLKLNKTKIWLETILFIIIINNIQT